MKILLLLALLISGFAHAASPEQDYLAARDGYIKRFNAKRWTGEELKRITAQELAALRDLERRLIKIVGPFKAAGFDTPGKINLEALQRGDMGFGTLDGLVFMTKDEKTRVVVTTEGLFRSWLRAHRNWWPKMENVPQDTAKALRWPSLYTQALSTDAAVGQYAEIPLPRPVQTSDAFAMLAARAQDIGPGTPDELIVSVVRGGRVFVVSAPAAVEIAPMQECRAIWDAAVKKAGEAYEKYRDSKDKRELALPNKLEGEGDAAFRRCYAERAPRDAGFQKLIAQAQAIVDMLPAR